MAAVTICSDLGAQESKVGHCDHDYLFSNVLLNFKIELFLWAFQFLFFSSFTFLFIFFTSQYCIGFAIHQHESTTGVHMFPILNPPQTSVFNSFGYMPRHRMVWSQSNFRLNLLRKHQAVSIVAALLYSQQQYIRVPITPASSPTLVIFHFYDFVILVGVKWYHLVALTCISLMTHDVQIFPCAFSQ